MIHVSSMHPNNLVFYKQVLICFQYSYFFFLMVISQVKNKLPLIFVATGFKIFKLGNLFLMMCSSKTVQAMCFMLCRKILLGPQGKSAFQKKKYISRQSQF